MSKYYKRLIVLSDGTWQNEASETLTNIVKLAKSIASESDDGVQQVLYYDSGVGTGGMFDAMLGGSMGVGIDVNIKQIYIWLACNYDEGDEIYMFGFSRGSYTVRSLAGFIYNCGLLRQEEISRVHLAYEIYRSRGLGPNADNAIQFRMDHSFRPNVGDRVRITLLACFDTVGALGIPDSAIGGKFDDGRYAFHDTKLSDTIMNAIHLLSVDEERGGFKPTLMTENQSIPGQLTQLYFPGRHSGVGGGEPTEVDLSNYALTWLVGEMKRRGLALKVHAERIEPGTCDVPPPPPLGWKDWTTHLLMNAVAGVYVRPIHKIEECHPSVAKRYGVQKEWRPKALKPIEKSLSKIAKDFLTGRRDETLALSGFSSDSDSDEE